LETWSKNMAGMGHVLEQAISNEAAQDYRASREIPLDGLAAWRSAIAEHTGWAPGMTVLDVGAGTGGFARALRAWFGVAVTAVEPDPAMRALIPTGAGIAAVSGYAHDLPVADAGAHGAWLGSVIHHLPDLSAAAAELRRALVPGAPILIRNTFPGRVQGDLRVRYFPESAEAIAGYPRVEEVCEVFAAQGFHRQVLISLPQISAPDLATYAAGLRCAADGKLRALSDEQYAAGLARLRAAAHQYPDEPAVSWMDLLVLG
jgi:ubiquinone/menaquinone biosynthesis C-methylase UbiE